MPLSQLKYIFTHYDLHLGNILIYEPVKGKYIQYNYHLDNGDIVKFKSPYIVKIIDYGRCYYKYDHEVNNPNPLTIYRNVCLEAKCRIRNKDFTIKSRCGTDMGFTWLDPYLNENGFFISSSINNQSHDLRLLNNIFKEYEKSILIPDNPEKNILTYLTPDEGAYINTLINMFKKVQYGIGITKSENKGFGTKPNNSSGLPSKINNVEDAENALREIILTNQFMKTINDSNYRIDDKLGDMHIYSDNRPMRFEPV
jgi:hypothetical protein